MHEDDDDARESARRDHVKRRQAEIYNEIENLWLDYLQELDYPRVSFKDYVAKYHKQNLSHEGVYQFIRIWKFVRSFSQMHLN